MKLLPEHIVAYYFSAYYPKSGVECSYAKPELLVEALRMAGGSMQGNDNSGLSVFALASGIDKGAVLKAPYFNTSADPVIRANEFFIKSAQLAKSGGERTEELIQESMRHHFADLPAVYSKHSSLSLYQLFRLASAFAEIMESSGSNNYLLIGADLSGLQSFLYNILSKHAAKNLKGRSFYLQLVIEDLLLEVQEKLAIKPWQVLYSSGGGFYCLAEQRNDTGEVLASIQRRRNKAMLREHGAELYLALASHPITTDQLVNKGGMGEAWKGLSEKLNQAKAARYEGLLVDQYDFLFEPSAEEPEHTDAITGRTIRGEAAKLQIREDDEDKIKYVYESTRKQIDLGKELKKAHFWSVDRNSQIAGFKVPGSGYAHSLRESNPTELKGIRSLRSFNGTTHSDAIHYGYGGNFTPDLDGKNPTFDALAKPEKNEIERLGVLRMDIDNLGSAFISGFNSSESPAGLYAEFSMRLGDFFTDKINEIAKQYKKIYIVYSGGDDMFVIGHWVQVLEFTKSVRRQFIDYMGGKECFTFSAGVALVTNKFPILKAGEIAGEAEAEAKNYHRKVNSGVAGQSGIDKTKDAISVFGTVLGWEEIPEVEEWRDWWLERLGRSDQKGINNGLLYKLLTYMQHKNKYPEQLNWQWNAAYNIARRRTDDNRQDIEALKNLIYSRENNYRALDLCCIGGRWTNFLTRNN